MRILKLTREHGDPILINTAKAHYAVPTWWYNTADREQELGTAFYFDATCVQVRETIEEIEAMLERQDQSSNV